jgi:hypothetical protein
LRLARRIKEKVDIVKDVGGHQLSAMKKESQDIKEIFDSDDLVFYKTARLAIVLRKLGGLKEFLDTVDNLTKEGYVLVWQEPVQGLLSFSLTQKFLGSFYYFQKQK